MLLTNKDFLNFVQRLAVIVMLGVFLCYHPEDKTAWTATGAVIMDLFHAAKNGNGHTNGNGLAKQG